MSDFLLELFSEEIPARMQADAVDGLASALVALLTRAGLASDNLVVERHVTPRRLAFHAEGLLSRAPDRTEEKRGPRCDAPEGAINGFLRSTGLTLDQLERRQTEKGEMFFAVSRIAGRDAADLLPQLVADLILGFTWPKSMRWRDTRLAWVRPLRSILALFDGQVLKGGFHLGVHKDGGRQPGWLAEAPADDINFLPYGAVTRGHRFLSPDPFAVTGFADYEQKLRAAHVILDAEERRAAILAGATRLAQEAGAELIDDPGLLDEVTGLVEWPVPLRGRIDDAFMEVPAEVLTTSMRSHQKYFAARRPDGSLSPHFITVANMQAADGGKTIIGGNERVLRARLSDAKFFWDQDRRKRLEDWAEGLKVRVFHAKLGTVAERVDRIANLAELLAPQVGADPALARRAALLAKADLSTGMVGEFPELQGIMGRYYALGQGEDAAVAQAIAEHYSPLGPSDRCPSAPVSVAVALADKLDLLAGFFAIDEKPTGSKDPFALRRAALGVIRLITENGLRLPLEGLFAAALGTYGRMEVGVAAALVNFFADRLKVVMRDKGVRHDLIQAVFANGEDDVVRLLKRVEALGGFLGTAAGADLLAAHRRAVNILKIEEKKDGRTFDGPVDPSLLTAPPEAALSQALTVAEDAVRPFLAAEDFAAAMAKLGELRDPVDAFFTDVTVNAEEASVRANRLALLARIRSVFGGIADFTAIEG